MAATILEEYADFLPGGVSLVPSSGGVFEISFNGAPIFSKKKQSRFPEPGEVEHLLEHAFGMHDTVPGPLAGGALDTEEMLP